MVTKDKESTTERGRGGQLEVVDVIEEFKKKELEKIPKQGAKEDFSEVNEVCSTRLPIKSEKEDSKNPGAKRVKTGKNKQKFRGKNNNNRIPRVINNIF
ncbi:hypothetical protein C1646_757811 [Rhizophagus diaphanus]|nr:hypothetical protein C1646_757811 [Rhizophagus diaphanus] [Rhizophagus sp. MUCL 43196]